MHCSSGELKPATGLILKKLTQASELPVMQIINGPEMFTRHHLALHRLSEYRFKGFLQGKNTGEVVLCVKLWKQQCCLPCQWPVKESISSKINSQRIPWHAPSNSPRYKNTQEFTLQYFFLSYSTDIYDIQSQWGSEYWLRIIYSA